MKRIDPQEFRPDLRDIVGQLNVQLARSQEHLELLQEIGVDDPSFENLMNQQADYCLAYVKLSDELTAKLNRVSELFDPSKYPEHCRHQVEAINAELLRIEKLQSLKEGPYADCADLLDELIATKTKRIGELCKVISYEARKSILIPYVPHALYLRSDIDRFEGEIRKGYASLNVLNARANELYELCMEDGVVVQQVIPALERLQEMIVTTNYQLASEIDKVLGSDHE